MKEECTAIFGLMMASLLATAGCSGSDGGNEGAGGPAEDMLRITMDGQLVPTDPDPRTAATYSAAFLSLGFSSTAPDGTSVVDDEITVTLNTNDIVPGVYPFVEDDRQLYMMEERGELGSQFEVLDFDGTTRYVATEGSLTLDGVSTGTDEDGDFRLRWVRGSFEGTFEDPADETHMISVEFAYVSG